MSAIPAATIANQVADAAAASLIVFGDCSRQTLPQATIAKSASMSSTARKIENAGNSLSVALQSAPNVIDHARSTLTEIA